MTQGAGRVPSVVRRPPYRATLASGSLRRVKTAGGVTSGWLVGAPFGRLCPAVCARQPVPGRLCEPGSERGFWSERRFWVPFPPHKARPVHHDAEPATGYRPSVGRRAVFALPSGSRSPPGLRSI